MGWNIVNMGVLGAFVGRAAYDAARKVVGDQSNRSAGRGVCRCLVVRRGRRRCNSGGARALWDVLPQAGVAGDGRRPRPDRHR